MNNKELKYIEALRSMPGETDILRGMEGDVPEELRLLGKELTEEYELATALANGDLQMEASSMNVLAGPLKDLQSNLRHLTWQAKQIEKGDYGQRAEFLGDFSQAFNHMAVQLARREETMRKQIRQQMEYYEALDAIHNNWRAYKHDMENHLLCIDALLDMGDVPAARDYIHAMHGKTKYMDGGFIYTGNRVLDALLTDKIRIAKNLGIEVTKMIAVDQEIEMDPLDCCILFGNAMDNAIEACQRIKSGERRIELHLKMTGNMLHMKLRNTSQHEPIMDKDGIKSRKMDDEHHGFGLKNMKKVVESYDGVWEIKQKDGWFTLSCLLFHV